MILSIDTMQAGECLLVKTPTAHYWLVMCGCLVADVYRKGNTEVNMRFLEKRRMSNRITEGESFAMADINNNPIAVIMVEQVQKLPTGSFSVQRG